jgi:hypothetical protein
MCCFCCEKETIDHVLFKCHVARSTWSVVAYALDNSNIPSGVGEMCAWVKSFKNTEMQQLDSSVVSAAF